MKDKQLKKYSENVIFKLINYFRNLFKRKEEKAIYEEEICKSYNKVILDKKEETLLNDIKINTSDIDKIIYKKKFLKYIDGNIEALKLLSIDRLIKLKEYYTKVIDENDKKIEKLKKC